MDCTSEYQVGYFPSYGPTYERVVSCSYPRTHIDKTRMSTLIYTYFISLSMFMQPASHTGTHTCTHRSEWNEIDVCLCLCVCVYANESIKLNMRCECTFFQMSISWQYKLTRWTG